MASARHTRAVLAIAFVLVCGGCAGGEDAAAPATNEDSAAAADQDQGDEGSAADDTDADAEEAPAASGGGCPVSECADGLLPELAGIPVPPTVEAYGVGQTEADRNDGVTGAQQLFLSGTVADARAFYEAEIEQMGVDVEFEFSEDDAYAVDYITADGEEIVRISIGPREFHPVELTISREPKRDI